MRIKAKCQVFKSFKHVSTKFTAGYNKIMSLDKKGTIDPMFGLIKRADRLAYCGSCKTIGAMYGQRVRLLLNHDMVFLGELLMDGCSGRGLYFRPLRAIAAAVRPCILCPCQMMLPV